jgi:RimJ/RimL family protein N-acetyltransferase
LRFRIVHDERRRVGEWVRERVALSQGWGEWYSAIGLERDGELVAGVVYNYYSVYDIAMHVASDGSRRWMTKDFLRAVFSYPFVQLGCKRVTGYVLSRNTAARRFDEHIGFVREGVMRQAGGDDDVIVYGMLESECRWHLDKKELKHDG